MTFVYLAIFAIIGAFARYGQSILVQNLMGRAFPFGTLSIKCAAPSSWAVFRNPGARQHQPRTTHRHPHRRAGHLHNVFHLLAGDAQPPGERRDGQGRAVCRRLGRAVDRGGDLRRIPVTQPQSLRMKIVNRAFEVDVR
jgi:hypothetical protein